MPSLSTILCTSECALLSAFGLVTLISPATAGFEMLTDEPRYILGTLALGLGLGNGVVAMQAPKVRQMWFLAATPPRILAAVLFLKIGKLGTGLFDLANAAAGVAVALGWGL